jgi:hypothetical protein
MKGNALMNTRYNFALSLISVSMIKISFNETS